jgi:hypothetical protein
METLAAGGERLLSATLGSGEVERLRGVDPMGWYPIQWLLELFDTLDVKLGRATLVRVGRTLYDLSHAERVAPHSALDIIEGIDAMYHHANRGEEIGGWRVLSFEPGQAELEKTTPHHCAVEEGILGRALGLLGIPTVIQQPVCLRRGGDACRFVITSLVTDARWSGRPAGAK